MKIYTGFGDKGKTALFGGKVVSKDDKRIETYGTLDELNSILGLLIIKVDEQSIRTVLVNIQHEIFIISSEIATPDSKRQVKLKNRISKENIRSIEKTIDDISENLDPLKNFILPGGSESAALGHIARTVCRRAERNLASLVSESEVRNELLVYLNRLGDLFFVLARFLNKFNKIPDVIWKS